MKTFINVVVMVLLYSMIDPVLAQSENSPVDSIKVQTIEPLSIPRLFSVQKYQVLRSMDASLLLGGAFGFSGEDGFLGTAAFGIGGYGDIEVSTNSLMGSIFSDDESFGNVALKIKMLDDPVTNFGLSLGLRSSNSWSSVRNSESSIRDASPTLHDEGLRGVNYDFRMTSLYLVFGKDFWTEAHYYGGLVYSDTRFKNISTLYNINQVYLDTKISKTTVFSFYGGFEKQLKNNTSLIFEIQSLPYMSVDTKTGRVAPKQRIIGVAGIRFVVNKWLILDSGIRYQDNYSGLADATIKIGVNGIWSTYSSRFR